MASTQTKDLNLKDLTYLVGVLQRLDGLGGKLDGEGDREVWHDISMPHSLERHQDAKKALAQMKAALKTLGAVTSSLEHSIQALSRDCIEEERAIGFASLPDEDLVHIFESYCEEYIRLYDHDLEGSIDSPMVLGRVCTRFRRIVLRIPSLWACVSSRFSSERISMLKRRCRNPIVFLKSETGSKQEIVDFIKELHPINQWYALNLDYDVEEDGSALFESLKLEATEPFDSLKKLSIRYTLLLPDDDDPLPTYMKKFDKIVSEWYMPSLESLELTNVLPSRKIQCPALKSCRIVLGIITDLGRLHDFIHSYSLASIDSLTVVFIRTETVNANLETRQHTFFKLKFLELEVELDPDTDPKVLKLFMGMIDAPILESLKINLTCRQHDDMNTLSRWLDAVFKPSEGVIRTFPNVLKYEISVQTPGLPELHYVPMLRALPSLTSLTMSIPGFRIPNFSNLRNRYKCIQELESISLRTCLSPGSENVPQYLSYLGKGEKLEEIKKVQLYGCCGLREQKEELTSLLGEKLAWAC
ncbi:hypothetical protein SCHPADRAFT_995904 [Schizopora paradoxa]|uniref:Uncharacterized protein n=1 Tax=Schizopora paradoxa TaxID=27342 RepID=A0A0H2RV29_9AGAM|nr:hypothetical protein SCHPADRAFT_995904 [Schizopora paradoxa]